MADNAGWLVDFFRAQARLGFEEGDYTRTRNSCERVIQKLPADVEAWQLLGEAALASKDFATAVRSFEHLLDLYPTEVAYAVQLGKAFVQIKAWDAAAAALQQALEIAPDDEPTIQLFGLVERMRLAVQALDQTARTDLGRNSPCPCGSGLKYKKCCLLKVSGEVWEGQLEAALQVEDWNQVMAILATQPKSTVQSRRAEGLALYHLGRRRLAKPLIEASLSSFPNDAELLAILGDLLLDDNSLTQAEALARRALALAPLGWRARLVIAICHIRQNDLVRAEAALRELVELVPSCRLAWERLSDLLDNQGRSVDALVALEGWTRREPNNPDAWFRLGIISIRQGVDSQQAMPFFQQAVALKADHYEALCWYGHCKAIAGFQAEGQQLLLQGLQIKPDYGPGWNFLGNLYQGAGRQHEAEGCFMRAVAISPDVPYPWNNLANTYLDANEFAEAENVVRQAISLNGDIASFWNNLGNVFTKSLRISEGMECFQKALSLEPDDPGAQMNYSTALSSFARCDESISLLEPLCDKFVLARSNILFVANCHPEWSAERIYQVYREQGEKYFPVRKYFSYANSRDPGRRLRVGYVSADFRRHACSNFTLPLLSHHDKSQVEIFIYSEVRLEDDVTEVIRAQADHWRRTVGTTDEQLAELIRQDGIDILVELSGHTAGNRLAVFALKPAPVQVTWWMGFGYTSGLKAIDYFLADEELAPPESSHLFSEEIWRITCPSIAYSPPESVPAVITPLPAQETGYITFGSLTRSIRLNHKVVRLWSEVLKRVPGSRLMLNSGPFKDSGICDYFVNEFAQYGIGRERLDMGLTSPPWSALAKMDIALDCFPHNSGTTLFESLWMGLPFITLRGRPSVGRIGAEILQGLGRSEWIADSEEEYVDKVVALASDIDALQAIRNGLREEMRQSPLCDGQSLAKRIEGAYRGMWQRYCEQGEPQ